MPPIKLRSQIKKITDHGNRVYTVDLVPERPLPRFKPGQFLHLALDDYDPSGFWPESRVFSIASSPAQRNHLRISYSVRGHYTARMENELHEGRCVWIKLPYGEFIVSDSMDVVLIAGGTGITAFTAFLESFSLNFSNDVYLVYGARSQSLLLYRDMIDNQANLVPKLKTFYFIEHLQPEDNSQPIEPIEPTQQTQITQQTPLTQQTQKTLLTQQTLFFAGSLSLAPIWSRLENPHDTTYYIAGPPAMIQTINNELIHKNIAPAMIKIDAWS